MPGVPGRAGVGFGCRFQEGVLGAFPGVFPENVFVRAPLVVVPFLLPPSLEGRVVLWEVSFDEPVVLLVVHGCSGAGQCGVDVFSGRGGGGGVVARSGSGSKKKCFSKAYSSCIRDALSMQAFLS